MICPVCNGSGRVRRRFLLFFTRRARCVHCLGTGEFPPPIVEEVRSAPGYIRDDDPFDRRSSIGTSSRDRDDSFEVGTGGRSGGGGGGASWGDASDNEPPVIADPFASDASVGDVAAAAAVEESSTEGSSSDGDSDSSPAY
jgi:hypothetical protein